MSNSKKHPREEGSVAAGAEEDHVTKIARLENEIAENAIIHDTLIEKLKETKDKIAVNNQFIADSALLVRNGESKVAYSQCTALEVRFADGLWRRGKLIERVVDSSPPQWKVLFDDGLSRDDIRLGS